MPPRFGGAAAPKCPTCDKSVYHAEQVMGPGGKIYHRPCLRCQNCGKTLDPGSVVDHDYDAYCRTCHSKQFGPRGYGIGHSGLVGEYRATSTSPVKSPQQQPGLPDVPLGSPLKVPNLGIKAPSPPATPSRVMLRSVDQRDNRSTAPQQHSARSGFPVNQAPSHGAAEHTGPIAADTAATRSVRDNGNVQDDDVDFDAPSVPRRDMVNPQIDTDQGPATLSQPGPSTFKRPLPIPPVPASKPGTLQTSPSFTRVGGVASIVSATIGAGRDLCPRCRSVVYAAEAVSALGCKWHKGCLRCTSCSTSLNGTNMVEKSGMPFCGRCHASSTLQDQGMITRPGLF